MSSTSRKTCTRAMSVVLALALACGCTAPTPWGAGAAAPPEARLSPVARLLDDASLAEASRQLAELSAPLRADGLPLGDGEGAAIVFDSPRLSVRGLALTRDPDGLALTLDVPPQTLPWSFIAPSVAEAACPKAAGTLALGPGRFTLPLGFTTDGLGRLRPRVAPRARWEGPLEVEDGPEVDDEDTSGCLTPDASTLADALTAEIPPAVDLALAPELAPLLGLDLAVVLASPETNADSSLDLRLRAREDAPVGPSDGGVAAWFDLSVHARPAPCVAPLALPAASQLAPYPAPLAGAGLAVPVSALEAALGAVVLAGHLCGEVAVTAPVDGPSLRALAPTFAAAFGQAPPAATVAWSPTALPRLAASGPEALTLSVDGLELALWATWEGARWRLASMKLDLEARLGVEVDADGRVTTRLLDLSVMVPVSLSGLLQPPSPPEARAVATAVLGQTLDGLTLLTLPPSLAPAATARARVDVEAARVTLPTR